MNKECEAYRKALAEPLNPGECMLILDASTVEGDLESMGCVYLLGYQSGGVQEIGWTERSTYSIWKVPVRTYGLLVLDSIPAHLIKMGKEEE